MKLLLAHCPKERYEDVAIPILKVVCPQMYDVSVFLFTFVLYEEINSVLNEVLRFFSKNKNLTETKRNTLILFIKTQFLYVYVTLQKYVNSVISLGSL